jgi:hypothetical protein
LEEELLVQTAEAAAAVVAMVRRGKETMAGAIVTIKVAVVVILRLALLKVVTTAAQVGRVLIWPPLASRPALHG